MKKHRLSIKAKKRLIAVLGTVVVLVLAVVIGGNLYIDSILNKMNQKDAISKEQGGVSEESLSLEERYNVINIALLGADGTENDTSHRTDVMKIISLDFNNDKITISSIQRDNLVYIPGIDDYNNFNEAYSSGGVESALQTLNYNLDLDITRYVLFDFNSVPKIVDLLGGVSLSLSAAEAGQIGLSGGGVYTLNGKQALEYSRIRNLDSDYGRMNRQNQVILAIVDQFKSRSPFELLDIVNQVMPYIETNVSNSEIKRFAMNLLSFDLGNITHLQFPENGYEDIEATVPIGNTSIHYILKDFQGNVAMLHEHIYGVKNYQVSDRLDASIKRMRELYLPY